MTEAKDIEFLTLVDAVRQFPSQHLDQSDPKALVQRVIADVVECHDRQHGKRPLHVRLGLFERQGSVWFDCSLGLSSLRLKHAVGVLTQHSTGPMELAVLNAACSYMHVTSFDDDVEMTFRFKKGVLVEHSLRPATGVKGLHLWFEIDPAIFLVKFPRAEDDLQVPGASIVYG